jgi:type 1 glutamine amidotransferase
VNLLVRIAHRNRARARMVVWSMHRLVLCLAFGLAACSEPRNGPAADAAVRALVFSRTTGFRHASIPAGIAAVQGIGTTRGFVVEATEDASTFTDNELARFRVVIFLNTTGDVLDDTQQGALERFVQAGGGFVGVHSATDTEYDWPWYGGLVGAYFDSHPAIQVAALQVVDPTHPSTAALPVSITRIDEWYDFRDPLPPGIGMLITIDEASYSGGTMGAVHPISWSQTYDGGRAWYTAMGHTAESYTEPLFLAHLAGGILWAARATAP